MLENHTRVWVNSESLGRALGWADIWGSLSRASQVERMEDETGSALRRAGRRD